MTLKKIAIFLVSLKSRNKSNSGISTFILNQLNKAIQSATPY